MTTSVGTASSTMTQSLVANGSAGRHRSGGAASTGSPREASVRVRELPFSDAAVHAASNRGLPVPRGFVSRLGVGPHSRISSAAGVCSAAAETPASVESAAHRPRFRGAQVGPAPAPLVTRPGGRRFATRGVVEEACSCAGPRDLPSGLVNVVDPGGRAGGSRSGAAARKPRTAHRRPLHQPTERESRDRHARRWGSHQPKRAPPSCCQCAPSRTTSNAPTTSSPYQPPPARIALLDTESSRKA